MKIKNISGASLTFGLSNKFNLTLANNAVATVDDDADIVADAYEKAAAGLLEITEGPATSGLLQSVGIPRHVKITLSADTTDDDAITIAGQLFEFDPAALTTGAVEVANGVSTAATLANFKTAINGVEALTDLGIVAKDVVTEIGTIASIIILIPDDIVTADIVITGCSVATKAVVAASDGIARKIFTREVTATADTLLVVTDLDTINELIYSISTAAGVPKYYDGAVTITGGSIFFDKAGSVDIAATDIITIIAYGK